MATSPLDGLHVQADFWRFEVSDRVLPQAGISALQPELDAFLVASQDLGNYLLNDSLSGDSPVINVPCDPNALEAQFGRDSDERLNCVVNPSTYLVSGISRAALSESANLITLTLKAVNAGEIEADGIDVRLAYMWDNDWGIFNASLDYTHVYGYELIDIPGLELGLLDTGVDDAAGTTGNGLHVRSLPDNKGHLTFSWMRDNHRVTIINRVIGSYQELAYDAVFETGNDFTRSRLRKSIETSRTWDVQYQYSHDWGNSSFGSTTITVGVIDLFDDDIPRRELGALGLNYDAIVHDPRGRRLYLRALWQI